MVMSKMMVTMIMTTTMMIMMQLIDDDDDDGGGDDDVDIDDNGDGLGHIVFDEYWASCLCLILSNALQIA